MLMKAEGIAALASLCLTPLTISSRASKANTNVLVGESIYFGIIAMNGGLSHLVKALEEVEVHEIFTFQDSCLLSLLRFPADVLILF
jgi:hypothetical protein